jgi:hypothetical protein
MQIVQNTPETLILRHRRVIRPWFTGFFALLFLVMAWFAYADAPGITYGFILIAAMLTLALFVFDLPVSTAVFSRREGTVTVSHRIFGRGNAQVIRLGSVRRAFAAISGANPMQSGTTMSGGQKCPTLELRQGKPVPLSAIADFSKSQDLAVQAINDWLGVKPDRS